LRKTRPFHAAVPHTVTLLFFLEGEYALAQAQAAPDAAATRPASGSLPFDEESTDTVAPASLEAGYLFVAAGR
jgi:hypothetical protein